VASGVKPPAESLETAVKPRPLETITEGFEEKDDGSIIDKMNTARNQSVKSPDPMDNLSANNSGRVTPPDMADVDPEAAEIAKMPERERIS